jgi:cysteine synthase
MYPSIENFVGNTPLVRLKRIPGDTGNVLLAKLEGNNPAGSVKDRPALFMIARAEQRGEIKPGDTLIEATSGNTGIALAMAAAMRVRRGTGVDAKRRQHGAGARHGGKAARRGQRFHPRSIRQSG